MLLLTFALKLKTKATNFALQLQTCELPACLNLKNKSDQMCKFFKQ